MRICFATYNGVMMLKGGPRTQVLQTCAGLRQRGVEVDLLDNWSEFDPRRYDLVHLFAANVGTYHLANTLRLNGVPFVVSPIFFSKHPAWRVRSVIGASRAIGRVIPGVQHEHALRQQICRWARAVLPNTQQEGDLIVGGLGIPRGKIAVIPNGVESRFAAADPGLFRSTYGPEPFVLNVGHVGPARKNVVRLIEALEGIDVRAFIIGRIERTPDGERCLALAKRNPRLTILDSLPHDSDLLASAYAACEVFALPSLFETPGIAALEAAAAGARVVITPHGGTRDNFGDLATYVEPTSVESIRSGIRDALAAPRTPELRERILGEFTWERIAALTQQAYKRVLEQRSLS